MWEDFTVSGSYILISIFLLSGAGIGTGSVGGDKRNEREKVGPVQI